MDLSPNSSSQASRTAADGRRFKQALRFSLSAVALMWVLFIALDVSAVSAPWLGVYPRRIDGLFGILTAPMIHGSIGHLVSNTLPCLILSVALLYGYPKAAPAVLIALYFGSGLAVWVWARPAWHIGASGVNTGLMFFLFLVGALRWDPRAIVLSMIAFFLYGGMVWGVLPLDPRVSFESHLSGALIGAILAVLLRRWDPPPPRKRYSWEDDDPRDEVPVHQSPDYELDRYAESTDRTPRREPNDGPRRID